MKTIFLQHKKSVMTVASCLLLLGGTLLDANAKSIRVTKMDFYPIGATTPAVVDNTIGGDGAGNDVGNIDTTAGTGKYVSDVAPYGNGDDGFFGVNWVADVQQGWDGPGTFTWSGTSAKGAFSYTFTLTANQHAVGVYFDWNGNNDIPVLAAFDCSNSAPPFPCTPIDTDNDGTPGTDMVTSPFPGQTPAFSGVANQSFSLSFSTTQGGQAVTSINKAGGNVTVDSGGSASGFTYSWASSDSALVTAAVGGTTNTTLVFDPSGLTLGQSYTAKVTATRTSDSATVTQTQTVTLLNVALLASNDTDGDGTSDSAEGTSDADGDGIPAFLDASSVTTELPLNTGNSNLGVMKVDSGTLAMGSTAITKSNNNVATTMAYTAILAATDISTTDSVMSSSCVGGCFDFKVTGLTTGGTAKIVIPLSQAIPSHPVYRKYKSSDSKWKGFAIDSNNSISSAAALTTSPITCPAPGSSSYSTAGLTPGHYCIQLTIKDGGENDDDQTANGTIVDPGGVADNSTEERTLHTQQKGGCSISTAPVNVAERADWWLAAGFIAALAGLRLYRRRSFN